MDGIIVQTTPDPLFTSCPGSLHELCHPTRAMNIQRQILSNAESTPGMSPNFLYRPHEIAHQAGLHQKYVIVWTSLGLGLRHMALLALGFRACPLVQHSRWSVDGTLVDSASGQADEVSGAPRPAQLTAQQAGTRTAKITRLRLVTHIDKFGVVYGAHGA